MINVLYVSPLSTFLQYFGMPKNLLTQENVNAVNMPMMMRK